METFWTRVRFPPAPPYLDADYDCETNRITEGSATPQVNNMGLTRFRQDEGCCIDDTEKNGGSVINHSNHKRKRL